MTEPETRDQSGNTPEQIITDALYAEEPEIHPQSAVQFMKASRRASVAAGALRAAGLLVEGAPTDEQVERAASAVDPSAWDESKWQEGGRRGVLPSSEGAHAARSEARGIARAALAAAGAAPPGCKECAGFGRVGDGPNTLGVECPECGGAGAAPSKAEHIASLTSMLKVIEWQINRDSGSQWLAGELYERGARAPQGHEHVIPSAPSVKCDDDGCLHYDHSSAPSSDREKLIAEAEAAWDAAGRMPQGTMVHETQWKPFAALYNVTERLIEALSVPDPMGEAKLPSAARARLRAFLELSAEGRYEYTARVGDREARIGADDLRVLLESLAR